AVNSAGARSSHRPQILFVRPQIGRGKAYSIFSHTASRTRLKAGVFWTFLQVQARSALKRFLAAPAMPFLSKSRRKGAAFFVRTSKLLVCRARPRFYAAMPVSLVKLARWNRLI